MMVHTLIERIFKEDSHLYALDVSTKYGENCGFCLVDFNCRLLWVEIMLD
jgi:hypothetical protein